MIVVNVKKRNQRILCVKKREILKNNNKNAHLKLTKQILKIKAFNKAKIVASFISIKSEISMEPINNFIRESKKKICLPVIIGKNKPLIFRLFDDNSILKKGKYDVIEPNEKSDELIPDFILTPCLAFDTFGYRMGYGGGFYDKTFAQFNRLQHTYISVAVAYEDQRVDKVIRNKFDQQIDYVLTEKEIYKTK